MSRAAAGRTSRAAMLAVVAITATPASSGSDAISGEGRPYDDIFGEVGNDTIGPVHGGAWDYVMFDAGAPETPGPDRARGRVGDH